MIVPPVEPSPPLPFPYRLLLAPYPQSFLEEFGPDLSRHLLLQRAESRYAGRIGGTVRFWWDASTDALLTGLKLRLEDAATLARALSDGARRHVLGTGGARNGHKPETGGVGMMVQAMIRDLRHALRSLIKSPGFAGWPCYRAGGNTCYASAPTAMNREHCIIGSSRCVAVSPSDSAPALIALDAQFVIQSRGGERVVDAEDFFMRPSVDIERMTILEPGELLTAIRLPSTWAGATFYYEKVEDRKAWDFALMTVASAMRINGGVIEEVRLAANGAAPYPMRLADSERVVRGQAPSDALGIEAGEVAVQDAQPLRHNEFKVPLMKNLIRRAIRGMEA